MKTGKNNLYFFRKPLSIKTNYLAILSFLIIILFVASCDLVDNDKKQDPPIIDPIGGMPSPYQDVSVSLDGQKLIFFRTKYTYVSKDGLNIQYDPDSTGIWICNIDGTNMKLIYKNDKDFIGRPQFIPNSNYILFNLNTQIVKAPYNGRLIEDDEIEFLTQEGKNFFPSINYDGSLIVFDSNKESPNGMNFIWSMGVGGQQKRRIAYEPTIGEIRMPSFSPISNRISHIRWIGVGTPEIFIMDDNGNNKIRITNNTYEDYEPRLNFNDSKITIIRNGSLIVAEINVNNESVLIKKSVQSATWNRDNKIILVWLFGYSKDNGTIWIMNEDGTDKKQITYNFGLILEGGEL